MGNRTVALASLTLAAACSTPAPYTVTQHGMIGMPRPALYDAQPLPTSARFEAYGGVARATGLGKVDNSGAAVAQHSAGGALRHKVGEGGDVGVEFDGSWSASDTTLSGDSSVSVGMPHAAVFDTALVARGSTVASDNFRIGFALALGFTSCPIHRGGGADGTDYDRDEALLARASVVGSYKAGKVTVFGAIGGSTETEIKETFTVTPDETSNNDPGVVAEAKTFAFTAAAGASYDVADRVHLSAHVADAFARDATFGPQVMLGLAFDMGDAPAVAQPIQYAPPPAYAPPPPPYTPPYTPPYQPPYAPAPAPVPPPQ